MCQPVKTIGTDKCVIGVGMTGKGAKSTFEQPWTLELASRKAQSESATPIDRLRAFLSRIVGCDQIRAVATH